MTASDRVSARTWLRREHARRAWPRGAGRLAFIAMPMVLFLVLQIFAIVYAFFISFFDWGIRGPREFVGLANYQDLLLDDRSSSPRRSPTPCS